MQSRSTFRPIRGVLSALLTALAVAACGAESAPLEEAQVRDEIINELGILATGIEREDAILASQPIDDEFIMGGNVAIRYLAAGWSGKGVGSFRSFFAAAFAGMQNISQEFELDAINVNGSVTTCQVTGSFSGVQIDPVPPQNVNASGTDYMTFQRKGGQWLLVRWDEVPPAAPPVEEPPAEGEGEGGA
jgi:hypothetical protein